MDYENGISSRLKEAREKRGLSARELSSLAGFSPSLVNQIENGRTKKPGFDKLVAFAKVLNISFEWLATGNSSATIEGS